MSCPELLDVPQFNATFCPNDAVVPIFTSPVVSVVPIFISVVADDDWILFVTVFPLIYVFAFVNVVIALWVAVCVVDAAEPIVIGAFKFVKLLIFIGAVVPVPVLMFIAPVCDVPLPIASVVVPPTVPPICIEPAVILAPKLNAPLAAGFNVRVAPWIVVIPPVERFPILIGLPFPATEPILSAPCCPLPLAIFVTVVDVVAELFPIVIIPAVIFEPRSRVDDAVDPILTVGVLVPIYIVLGVGPAVLSKYWIKFRLESTWITVLPPLLYLLKPCPNENGTSNWLHNTASIPIKAGDVLLPIAHTNL